MKPPLPPSEEAASWEPPPQAWGDIDLSQAPAGGWVKKVWQSLTGATLPGGGPTCPEGPGLGACYRHAEVPMTCSVYNRRFIVLAEARGDVCFFVENRLSSAVLATRGRYLDCEPLVMGQFKYFDAHPGWRCPHCGARDNPILPTHLVWLCMGIWPNHMFDCRNYDCKMMCAGSIGRASYCACGHFAKRRIDGPKSGELWGPPLEELRARCRSVPGGSAAAWPVYSAPLGSPVASDRGRSVGFFPAKARRFSAPAPLVLWSPP
jgi:hypothetical protein